MPDKPDIFYLRTGRHKKDLRKEIPTAEAITHQRLKQTTTKYPLRVVSPDVFFTEEQRGNTHIIGSSRQGKSRFLEWLMREDIDRGIGCCLLDPTAGGETAYRMLSYCTEKGRQNVLFIDPSHADPPYKKVIGLQPFKYTPDGQTSTKLRRISITTLMNAVRSLYSVKDPAKQSYIERYLPAVFTALYDAQSPLTDAKYFSNRLFKEQRDEILLMTDEITKTDIQEAYLSSSFNNFQTTVNRLMRFMRGTVGLMFSAPKGVNWMKLIRDHWVVIVNLAELDEFDARLLGTYIIAELETAKQRLNHIFDEHRDVDKRGAYPPYYLYADEAFMFASQSLKNMLDLKQKMNFKLTLAHHYAKQFDDPSVYDSILQNCDITAMFYARSHEDRKIIATQFYGGQIDFEDAAQATKNLQKQNAVIKIGKDAPAFTKIPNVPTPKISKEALTNYILELYRNEWYYDSDKLEPTHSTHDRPPIQPNPVRPEPRKPSHRPPDSEASVPRGIRTRRKQQSVPAGDEEPEKASDGRPIKI
jgi:hypothetical protein